MTSSEHKPHSDLAEQGRRYAEQVRGGVVLSTHNLAEFIDNLVEQYTALEEAARAVVEEIQQHGMVTDHAAGWRLRQVLSA